MNEITTNLSTAVNCSGVRINNEWPTSKILNVLGLTLFTTFVILSNILVIVAVYKNPKLKNVTNMFITALAISDLLIGVFVLPFAIFIRIEFWIFGSVWCTIWRLIVLTTCSASFWNLCTISVVRYIAATHALRYNQIMSPKRAKILIACVWTVAFIIALIPLIIWDKDEVCPYDCSINYTPQQIYYITATSYVPTLIMIFCYWRIYLVARSLTKAYNRGFVANSDPNIHLDDTHQNELSLRVHRKSNDSLNGSIFIIFKKSKIDRLESTRDSNASLVRYSRNELNITSTPRIPLSCERQKPAINPKPQKFRIRSKAGRTLTVIVGVHICCWMPFFVTYTISGYSVVIEENIQWLLNITSFLGFFNSALNPWICAYFYQDFGTTMKKILRTWFCVKT